MELSGGYDVYKHIVFLEWNDNNACSDSLETNSVYTISIQAYVVDILAVVKNCSRIAEVKFSCIFVFVPDTLQCVAMFWFLMEVFVNF